MESGSSRVEFEVNISAKLSALERGSREMEPSVMVRGGNLDPQKLFEMDLSICQNTDYQEGKKQLWRQIL